MSPASKRSLSSEMVCAVISPAGSMTHTARGLDICSTICDKLLLGVAPSFANCATLSGFTSNTTEECPCCINRRTIFPPIRPKPIIPSCTFSPSTIFKSALYMQSRYICLLLLLSHSFHYRRVTPQMRHNMLHMRDIARCEKSRRSNRFFVQTTVIT